MRATRIPDRMVEFLEGSQAAVEASRNPDPTDPTQALILRFRAAKPRKDRAYWLHLSEGERAKLLEWADYLANASGDNARDRDMDALADLNAANATIRQLTRST